MMKRTTAAGYLDMGPQAFSREVERGRLAMPVRFGGTDHWHRPDIVRARQIRRSSLPYNLVDCSMRGGDGEIIFCCLKGARHLERLQSPAT